MLLLKIRDAAFRLSWGAQRRRVMTWQGSRHRCFRHNRQLPLPKWRRHMLSGYCTCDRKPRARARAGATDSAGTAAAAPASAAGGGAGIHFTISCWSHTCTVTVRCSRRGPSRDLALDRSHASAAELASPAGAGTPHRAAAGWRGGGAPARSAGGTPECRPAAWKQPAVNESDTHIQVVSSCSGERYSRMSSISMEAACREGVGFRQACCCMAGGAVNRGRKGPAAGGLLKAPGWGQTQGRATTQPLPLTTGRYIECPAAPGCPAPAACGPPPARAHGCKPQRQGRAAGTEHEAMQGTHRRRLPACLPSRAATHAHA